MVKKKLKCDCWSALNQCCDICTGWYLTKNHKDKENKKMYLEISPRRSGKTTRLVEEALKWAQAKLQADNSFTAFICSTSVGMTRHLIRLFMSQLEGNIDYQYLGLNYCESNSKSNTITFHDGSVGGQFQFGTSKDLSSRDLDWDRRFFDEFDFIEIDPSLFHLKENDYYATTPKSIRTLIPEKITDQLSSDMLLALWLYNKGEYITFPSSMSFAQQLKAAKQLGESLAMNEVFGQFIEITPELLSYVQVANELLDEAEAEAVKPFVTVLSEKEYNASEQLLSRSDIVLRHYPDKKSYYVVKNRFGLPHIWLYDYLLEKFLDNPSGRLDWVTE